MTSIYSKTTIPLPGCTLRLAGGSEALGCLVITRDREDLPLGYIRGPLSPDTTTITAKIQSTAAILWHEGPGKTQSGSLTKRTHEIHQLTAIGFGPSCIYVVFDGAVWRSVPQSVNLASSEPVDVQCHRTSVQAPEPVYSPHFLHQDLDQATLCLQQPFPIPGARSSLKPKPSLQAIPELQTGCSLLSVGPFHALAVKEGHLWSWGFSPTSNLYGALGRTTPHEISVTIPAPVSIGTLEEKVSHIAAGSGFSLVAAYDLKKMTTVVYTFGYARQGQLGIPEKDGTLPEKTLDPTPVMQVNSCIYGLFAGVAHSLIWTHPSAVVTLPPFTDPSSSHARLWSFGNNNLGQLGQGHVNKCVTPHPITFFENAPLNSIGIVQVAIGDYHGAVLLGDSSVFVWGDNRRGQIGVPQKITVTAPTRVIGLPRGKAVKELVAGGAYTAFLLEEDKSKKRHLFSTKLQDPTLLLMGTIEDTLSLNPTLVSTPPREINIDI